MSAKIFPFFLFKNWKIWLWIKGNPRWVKANWWISWRVFSLLYETIQIPHLIWRMTGLIGHFLMVLRLECPFMEGVGMWRGRKIAGLCQASTTSAFFMEGVEILYLFTRTWIKMIGIQLFIHAWFQALDLEFLLTFPKNQFNISKKKKKKGFKTLIWI